MGEMQNAGMNPNMISFNAAISACEKGDQWERTLSLLEELRKAGVTLGIISFHAACTAVATAGELEGSLRLLPAFEAAFHAGKYSAKQASPCYRTLLEACRA